MILQQYIKTGSDDVEATKKALEALGPEALKVIIDFLAEYNPLCPQAEDDIMDAIRKLEDARAKESHFDPVEHAESVYMGQKEDWIRGERT